MEAQGYSELVEALRHLSTGRCEDSRKCELCAIYETCLTRCVLDAAAAIEALQAEVATLKHDIERYVQMNTELLNDRPELEEIGGKWVWKLPKRGKWIGVSPMVDTVQCSVCGGQLFSAELETPYCPYCGAEMEETEDEVHSDI